MRGWDGKNVEMGTGDGNPGVKGVETLWQCGIPKVIKTGRNREKRFLQHCAIFCYGISTKMWEPLWNRWKGCKPEVKGRQSGKFGPSCSHPKADHR